MGNTMEPGDWKCYCGEVNFKKRDACRNCHKPKGRIGDWACSCGELNFASRNNCRKCNKPTCMLCFGLGALVRIKTKKSESLICKQCAKSEVAPS